MVAAVQPQAVNFGRANLEVQLVAGESTVISAFSTAPLKLLVPRTHGTSVWAYVATLGGGYVGGDQTRLDLDVGAGSRCLVGTQASTKVYRSPDARQSSHRTEATLGPESLLVLAPDHVQPFSNSAYTQCQHFHLASSSSLVLLDWFTSGRKARGECWAFSYLASRNEIFIDGQRVLLDALRLDTRDGSRHSSHRVGRFNCFATVVLLGPAVRDQAVALLSQIASEPIGRRAALVYSGSPLRDGAILRLAAEEDEPAGRLLRNYLCRLSDLLGDDPWLRRW